MYGFWLGCIWEARQSAIHGLCCAGLPSGVTLVPSTTLTSLYLNSPNISAARAFICQGDAYLVSLNVLNGFGNTNSGKDAPSSISYIAGNCSDGTNLPDFSYDFNNPNFDTTCPRLGYPYGYTFLGRLYTYQDVALNLSSLAQRFTYRQAFQPYGLCSSICGITLCHISLWDVFLVRAYLVRQW